jgi:toxin ParE1/3/4
VRRLSWSPRAIYDLREIRSYIAQFDPAAASRIADRLIAATAKLERFPRIGREVSSGVRQLSTVRPYLIRYRVADDRVEILSVRHGARQQD